MSNIIFIYKYSVEIGRYTDKVHCSICKVPPTVRTDWQQSDLNKVSMLCSNMEDSDMRFRDGAEFLAKILEKAPDDSRLHRNYIQQLKNF